MYNQPSPQEEEELALESAIDVNKGKELKLRFSTNMYPALANRKFIHPQKKDKISYDVHLTGIDHNAWQFNFVMSDGSKSQMPVDNAVLTEGRWDADNRPIKRVTVYHDPRDHITGIQLFDA